MLRGTAFQQFPDSFVAGLKAGIFEGLTKTVSTALNNIHADLVDCQSTYNCGAAVLCIVARIGRTAWIVL